MKKLLNTLYVTDETAYLSLDGENIVIKMSEDRTARFPLVNLQDIVCFSYLGCSPALMGKCGECGIGISFLSPEGRFLGRLQTKIRGNVLLRAEQIRRFSEYQLDLIRNTVAAKLANTRFTLCRSLRDRPEIDGDGAVTALIGKLESSIENVYTLEDKDVIMGVEGSCAKSYFNIFDRMITQQKDDFRLTMRTKRPPLDKTNALLSFLYTILTNDYASALESVGLDSYVGFYHELRSGRSSLACDLVEEARSIIDRFVLTVINLKQINANDFEKQSSGAVLLTKDGRKKLLTLWQEKKRSDIMHPYLKQKIKLGLLPFVQSNLFAKYIRGELKEYPAFLLK